MLKIKIETWIQFRLLNDDESPKATGLLQLLLCITITISHNILSSINMVTIATLISQ